MAKTYRVANRSKTDTIDDRAQADLNSPDYVKRLIAVLDTDPYTLAAKLGIEADELLRMSRGARGRLAPVDQDEAFVLLAQFVNDRIGRLLAVRAELQHKLTSDRTKRLAQRMRIEGR